MTFYFEGRKNDCVLKLREEGERRGQCGGDRGAVSVCYCLRVFSKHE